MEVLRIYGGTKENLLNDTEVMRHFLPIIRADLEANRLYNYFGETPFDFPITAVVGESDPVTPLEEARAWSEQTRGGFDFVVVPGGHFFFRDNIAPLAVLLEREALR